MAYLKLIKPLLQFDAYRLVLIFLLVEFIEVEPNELIDGLTISLRSSQKKFHSINPI